MIKQTSIIYSKYDETKVMSKFIQRVSIDTNVMMDFIIHNNVSK